MTIDLTGLVRPHVVEMTKRDDNPNAAEFRLQPLERGFGYTLGNSLRRLLLSSLRGSAVWGFRLDGVVHEHQTVPGVLEDVHQIIQRLKALTLVLADDVDEAVLHIRREGAGPVYGRDIQEHGSVRVVNPDHLLFTLQDDREISGELYVNKGRGYVEAELHPADRSLPVDLVRIDAIYNPVRRANFTVAETRVGQRTDYDRLTVALETNGTITPEDAIAYAAALAQEHFRYFVEFGRIPTARDGAAGTGLGPTPGSLRQKLNRLIDDFGLSVRSLNSLKNSNIRTLRDLVEFSEDDLLKVKNVGEKAIQEIADLLQREQLNFGMRFEEAEGDLRVANPGAPPSPHPMTMGEGQ
ncbi:MAG TPA: DNA-directed RNA polymerase subunit alpha [Gemmatimonadales bacterium]|jgi:DNA-directed RNA polymerase subunit alpha|nr:DNA-directed RNA polymerase subunit alpha [Gemmatimonadales bacterium]